MSPREPVRLLEPGSEASSELRELLGAASFDEPSAGQLASLAGKLGPLLGPPGGAPPASPAQGSGTPQGSPAPGAASASSASGGAASAVASGLKLKVLAGVAGAVLVGGSFQAGRVFEREHPRSPPPVERAVAVRQPVSEPPRADATPPATPAATPELAAASKPAATPEPAPTEVPPPTPRPETSTAPTPRVSRPRATAKPVPAPATATEQASMDEELALLESAYQSLQRGDAAAALAGAERHAARFPDGALAQEREVLTIDALVRMGRRAEAGSRAESFRARYPTSTHWVRIQNLLSGAKP